MGRRRSNLKRCDLGGRHAVPFVRTDSQVVGDRVAKGVEALVPTDHVERGSTLGNSDVAEVLSIDTEGLPGESVRHGEKIKVD